MSIISGKKISQNIFKYLKNKANKLRIKPSLAIIFIGKNKESEIYVKIKQKRAKQLGLKIFLYKFNSQISEKKIINLIKRLNKNKKIKGIIVQLPLPKKFNSQKIIQTISPKKDIDGFLLNSKFKPPVYQAILRLLKETKIDLKNKKITILANSNTFAQPLAKIFLKKKGQVKIILKNYKNLLPKNSDIIITALGKPKYIKPKMVKKGVIIIDVGIKKINKKVYGDVDPKTYQKCKFVSSVPGGVGPLTVAYLFKNLISS